jgi:hypothetical protein
MHLFKNALKTRTESKRYLRVLTSSINVRVKQYVLEREAYQKIHF